MKIIINSFLLPILVIASCGFLQARSFAERLSGIPYIPYISENVVVDGILDDKAWERALEIELDYEVFPGENIAAPVATKVLVFENGENLFVAFQASDPDPEVIRAYLSDRDLADNSDMVFIELDTFNDSRSAFHFAVNPRGVQTDQFIDERTKFSDISWDSIWYSAGKVTSNGYQVEIQIPFNSLRFPSDSGEKNWGIQFGRLWPREVVHRLANAPVDRNISCQICQFSKFSGFSKATAPTNITLIPALTLLKSQQRLPGANQAWRRGNTQERTSLDIRWGISRNTYLNATINPDFSQVEADALQLDVNNLSTLFLKEKRAFFKDGADFFDSWSRFVYTRIFEEPNAGIKVTGKVDGHSYGLMNVQDKHTNLLFPYEYGTELLSLRDTKSDNTILRYRYDLGEKGNIGSIMTLRQGQEYQSALLGFDGKYWFSENDSFRYQILTSETDYPSAVLLANPQQQAAINGNAYSLNYQHESRNWIWNLTLHHFGEDFRADTGFISNGNWERMALVVDRIWFPQSTASWWKKIRLQTAWKDTQEIDDTPIEKGVTAFLRIDAIYEAQLGLGLTNLKQTYINENAIQQNLNTEFDKHTQLLWAEFSPVPQMNVEIEYDWGDDIDYSNNRAAKVKTLTSAIELQLSTQLSSRIEHISESLEVDNSPEYQIDLINFLLAYQINENSFMRLILQSRHLSEQPLEPDNKIQASQLIYSYKINPFTLLYFGYSDKYRTDINRMELQQTDKTLFMKFSYAWQI